MTQKRWPIATMLSGMLLLFSFGLFAATAFGSQTREAPIKLSSFEYSPPATVCPGDTLAYSVRWEVTRPAQLRLYPTFNVGPLGDGGHVLPAHEDDVRYLNQRTPGAIINDDVTFIIPNFKPGDYSRVVSIGTMSEESTPVFVNLPFTIPDTGCDDSDN